MLDIWQELDTAQTTELLKLILERSGHSINRELVKTYECRFCPYENYRFLKLEIQPGLVKSSGSVTTITSDSVSFLLMQLNENPAQPSVWFFERNSNSIFAVNQLTSFTANQDNAIAYAILFGLIVKAQSGRPFYFFSSLNHIQSRLREMPDDEATKVENAVQAHFEIDANRAIDANPIKKKRFPIGQYFSLKLPCLHYSHMFITTLWISKSGLVTMSDDNPLTIQGLYDPDENRRDFWIYADRNFSTSYDAHKRSRGAGIKFIGALNIATIRSFLWLLPLLFFQVYLLWFFGTGDRALYLFYEQLKVSGLLNWMCLIIGAIGLLVAIVRYIAIEWALFATGRGPTQWEALTLGAKALSRKAASNLGGSLILGIVNLLSEGVIMTTGITLLIYGAYNIFGEALGVPSINFGESLLFALVNIPIFGSLLSAGIDLGLYGSVNRDIYEVDWVIFGIGFIFSTILAGTLWRIWEFSQDDSKT